MARSPAPREDRRWLITGIFVIVGVILLYALFTWWAYEDERGTPTGEIQTYDEPVTPENPPAAQ